MQSYAELTRAFEDADNAWQAELVAAFGRDAGDVRYTRFAHGAEGSSLRDAYEARRAASDAWCHAKQFN